MGSDAIQEGSASVENVSSGELDAESVNNDSLEVVSSGGYIIGELESAAETLTRVELDLACSSEKLVNLDILVMHVASRENDFEAFSFEDEHAFKGSVEKALEFDLLYGILDSEVTELDNSLSALQTEITSFWEAISLFGHLDDDSLNIMEEKLRDCEESLTLSFEQLSEIKMQSANFRRILLSSSGDEKWKDDNDLMGINTGNASDSDAKIKMQTAEQQRHVLRMLEKSLAREMDLEKKLSESRQIEEELKLRLQQEVLCMEEDAEDILERLIMAENSAEILSGVSKELSGKMKMTQFNINGLAQREGELRSAVEDLKEQLKDKDFALQTSQSSSTELVEKVKSLEQKLKELESQLQGAEDSSEKNKELNSEISKTKYLSDKEKEVASEAEKRAESAEAECKLLRESSLELKKDLDHLKSSTDDATEKMDQLERQLKDSEIKRLHAEASVEASQEKQNMLDCTITDMENLIQDLKVKVLKAESQTESAEDKCIILSESNAELSEEIDFLRGKIKSLEKSLHQADESKKRTAKDISTRTKFIADLILQLALERERLHKQILSLTKQKKVAVKYPHQININPSVTLSESHDAKAKESENDIQNGTSSKESYEEMAGLSNISFEIPSTNQIRMVEAESNSKSNTVRNIDASQLNFKYVIMAILVLVLSAFAAFLFQK